MNTTNDNISIRLDTLADILDHDIKQYEKVSKKIGDLYEASDLIYRTLGRTNPAYLALEQEITTLNTESDWRAERNAKNTNRYWSLVEEYEEQYEENYIPERGANWEPNWHTSEPYDDSEPTWDAVSRHDSNEGW
jgi:hypothetical protein